MDFDHVRGVLERATGEHRGEDGRACGKNDLVRRKRHSSGRRVLVGLGRVAVAHGRLVHLNENVAHLGRRVEQELREVAHESFETTRREVDALALVVLLILGLLGDGIVHDRDAHVDLQLIVVERFILEQCQRIVFNVIDEAARIAALVDRELSVLA